MFCLIDEKKTYGKDLGCILEFDQQVPGQCSSFHRLVERDWCTFLIVFGCLLHKWHCKQTNWPIQCSCLQSLSKYKIGVLVQNRPFSAHVWQKNQNGKVKSWSLLKPSVNLKL